MTGLLSALSAGFLPGVLTFIILWGMWKRVPVYDCFVEGAKDGLKTAAEILPFIITIFVGIEALGASGAMEQLELWLAPGLTALGIPKELMSLILLRPVSGSGSLVLVQQIMEECGPDSFAGRAACVMTGSCETVFYVIAVYFGVTNVKKIRHTLSAGILGYLAGVIASLILCRFM